MNSYVTPRSSLLKLDHMTANLNGYFYYTCRGPRLAYGPWYICQENIEQLSAREHCIRRESSVNIISSGCRDAAILWKTGQCLYESFRCYSNLQCHVLSQDRSVYYFVKKKSFKHGQITYPILCTLSQSNRSSKHNAYRVRKRRQTLVEHVLKA